MGAELFFETVFLQESSYILRNRFTAAGQCNKNTELEHFII
jgi:hypothetical protein